MRRMGIVSGVAAWLAVVTFAVAKPDNAGDWAEWRIALAAWPAGVLVGLLVYWVPGDLL